MVVEQDFWRGRRVLVTGHTGFKGAWLALWLESLGAEVHGLALAPATSPNLFDLVTPRMASTLGDLRDPAVSRAVVAEAGPEIVFHLAARALVRPSYAAPLETFETNVMGTANLLDALRDAPALKAIVVVTSDKTYRNDGGGTPFREADPLGGDDPYSASKACQEMVAAAYAKSFFQAAGVRLVSARAGNVIGGGDWSADRLVPDFMRATAKGEPLALRYPDAIRPWQHVLEPLAGYLAYGRALLGGADLPDALNFAPDPADARPVGWVADRLVEAWNGNGNGNGNGNEKGGDGASWSHQKGEHLHEAGPLFLDGSLAKKTLGIEPRLPLAEALAMTVAWYRAHAGGRDMRKHSLAEIGRYER
jgi:CDP-glucose 4,6-dehydratase